jgi:apolipoprotein N-acyltransferase
MYQRYEQEQLWGYLPLWWLSAGWAAKVATLGPSAFSKLPQRNQLLWMSSLSGLLLAMGFVPMPFVPTLFFGLVPLLWVEDQISRSREGMAKWLVFKYSFNTFLIWNILSTFWVLNASFFAGILANSLNAVFMATVFMAYHVVKKKHNETIANLALASFWIAFEYLHFNWEISWPWLALGNGFAHVPWMIQWYEYTGVFGGSLWVLVANIWIGHQFNEAFHDALSSDAYLRWATIKQLLFKPLIWIVSPLLLSLGMYVSYQPKGKSVEVVTVQPNFEPHYQKFRLRDDEQFPLFTQTAQMALTDSTAYLLFPETSFDGIEVSDLGNRPIIQWHRGFLKQYPKTYLVMGIGGQKIFRSHETPSRYARKYCAENGNCTYYEAHNSALQLHSDSSSAIPYYIKSKLVPGAETMPYIGQIDLFKGLILSLGGVSGDGLAKQEQRMAFESPYGKVSPLICYESVYGEFVTECIKRGAQALFVLTNDGWWDKTPGHVQHLHFARLRAIETRRDVVRSANTGISAFINQKGEITQASVYNERIALRGQVRMNEEITFYVRYGDLIGRIAAFMTALIMLSTLVRFMPNQGRRQQ